MGELIVVATQEGKNLNAYFVKEHIHKFYQVRGPLLAQPVYMCHLEGEKKVIIFNKKVIFFQAVFIDPCKGEQLHSANVPSVLNYTDLTTSDRLTPEGFLIQLCKT